MMPGIAIYSVFFSPLVNRQLESSFSVAHCTTFHLKLTHLTHITISSAQVSGTLCLIKKPGKHSRSSVFFVGRWIKHPTAGVLEVSPDCKGPHNTAAHVVNITCRSRHDVLTLQFISFNRNKPHIYLAK